MARSGSSKLTAAVFGAVWKRDLDARQGWRASAVRLLRLTLVLARDLTYGQLTLRATGLVYTTLLSLVPLLALSFSVLKAFGVYNQIDPMLLKFLAPLGDKAGDVSRWLVRFIENLDVKVLGSIGLALLVYTVVSLIQRIEESLNFIWHVDKLRSFARRFSGYLSVLLIGPVLVFSLLGVISAVLATPPAKLALSVQPVGGVVYALGKVLPMFFVIGVFAFIYYFAPNARVRPNTALIGGIVAGLLWHGASWAFAEFARTSTQYAAIYSSFAIFLLFLIWLYLNWLILLLGASIAFYLQHPEYLIVEQGEPRLSNRMRERAALVLMHLIALHFKQGARAWTFAALTQRLGVPAYALHRLVGALQAAGLLQETADDPPAYLPSRDLGAIALADIVRAVRTAGEERYLDPDALPAPPELEPLLARLHQAHEDALRGLTLRDIATPPESGERARTAY